MNVTLPDGTKVTINGDKRQIERALRKLGIDPPTGPYYWSKSRGYIPVRDMTDSHLKNATRRAYINRANSLDTSINCEEFYKSLFLLHNSDLKNLLGELRRRSLPW